MNDRNKSKKLYNLYIGLMIVSLLAIAVTIGTNQLIGNDLLSVALAIFFLFTTFVCIWFAGSVTPAEGALELEFTSEQFKDTNYSIDTFTFNEGLTQGLALDERNKMVLYIDKKDYKDKLIIKEIPFDEVLEVTVSSNNTTLTSVSKGDILGGAIIGGILSGGVGSVIGAMGASKTSTDIVKELSLMITIDDLTNPLIKFNSINTVVGYTKNSAKYKSALDKVDNWFSKFTIIMKRNEKINNII